MTAPTGKFMGVRGRKLAPTLQHRPAIWECMLGTVYAMSPSGEVRYFDYDHDAAVEFAEISADSDPRIARPNRRVSYTGDIVTEPRARQTVLWVTR